MTQYMRNNMHKKVVDLIQEGIWSIQQELQQLFQSFSLPYIGGGQDKLFWTGTLNGKFSTSSAITMIRHKEPKMHCSTKIWNSCLHPSTSSNIWKIVQGVFIDDSVMVDRDYSLASRCCICENEQDSMNHLLRHCSFSVKIWIWICSIFGFSLPVTFDDIWTRARNCSPLIRETWITAACSVIKELWFQKNERLFEDIKPNEKQFKSKIKKMILEGGYRMKSNKWNQNYDLQIINFLILVQRAPGFGVVVRDHTSQVLGILSGSIGIGTNYIAQVYGVGKVPWLIDMRWRKATSKIASIIYMHSFRETNFSADSAAKRGSTLAAGERHIIMGRPSFLTRIELP
ncbi:uncharacterized protein LOC113335237 [Papaver somniferum]|uniref:uncharacterized protein LOC113335237 n=1 Tax=Papaver somniferum TaxID=3469 RepID=UPI000E6FC2EF|nr:uncharacterized protein LOC113335237 [Papaver somniferum]